MADRRRATDEELLGGPNFSVTERTPPGLINIRLLPRTDLIEGVSQTAGVPVPLSPNNFHATAERQLLWLGPDEWLLIAASGEEAGLIAALDEKLGNSFHSVVDVSGQYSVFDVQGPAAGDILNAGCSLDLAVEIFGPGRCAQTLLARATIILMRHDQNNFRLLCRRSYASYVRQWFGAAACLQP